MLNLLNKVNLGLNSIKCNNVFSNKIKTLHVTANDGHHRKACMDYTST
jgi:hypothetical protein